MDQERFQYILRFALQPGHYEKENIDRLMRFCTAARINDVMFFINCEELNQGHLSLSETRPWVEVISHASEKLETIGVTTSINPWITLLHADRGRKLKEGQNFMLMTDPYGNRANAVVCPLCDKWREYLQEIYALYASIRPHMLWVEDDFRFHNHEPLYWGGCFCDRHMEIYSRMANRYLERKDFIDAVLSPGEPHPYRKIWLDVSRQTMTELASIIGQAVHRVSPETRVGLMSSSPSAHCSEGRDWEGILGGLSSENVPMVNRPHLPSYAEVTPQNYLWNFSSASLMTKALIPSGTELYPELENFQFTRFSKSNRFTRFEVESTLCMQAKGVTMNLFDMMGNGALLSEGYQDSLAYNRNFIDTVKKLEIGREQQQSVKIMFSSKSSYTLHTEEGKSMTELYPRETFWCQLLNCYGIANVYCRDQIPEHSIIAVSGQFFRNISEIELKRLFADNFVLLEAEAAYTLFDMGYGWLAGIGNARWHLQDSGYQAYEQVCSGYTCLGVEEARMSAQVSAGDFLEIEYVGQPFTISDLKDPYGKNTGSGMTLWQSRVFILPYGRFKGIPHAHLNPFRQLIIQDILKSQKIGTCPVFIRGAPYLAIFSFHKEDQKCLMLLNSSGDDLQEIVIYAPGYGGKGILEFNRVTGAPESVEADMSDEWITLKSGIKNMELKVLVWPSNTKSCS